MHRLCFGVFRRVKKRFYRGEKERGACVRGGGFCVAKDGGVIGCVASVGSVKQQ